ncbi:MAG: methionine biosynthesis protein MetW [Pseudomonadales bacterium]|nr:methionine biosynthesis protein MetW [Pseudomonadales bacterium]MCP5330338.1 methionine biosynthesis protein MetW [Pseudomonadales bacterium]MCP5344049.1 methionine biosynthesis protein MetW [Pseudomonadales bacterium]
MRPDLDIIQHWIRPGSRVLDLGCGDGSLLEYLKIHRDVSEIGLEISPEKIQKCLARGVNVIEQDLNKSLANFKDKSFDTVLLTQTLQAVSYPDVLIDEMLRIGRNCIVTFPNFGHWRARLYLTTKGRMPVSNFMPYQWYNTPNIHFCTVRDFDVLCREKQIKIISRTVVDHLHQGRWRIKLWPNMLGETAIYHISR